MSDENHVLEEEEFQRHLKSMLESGGQENCAGYFQGGANGQADAAVMHSPIGSFAQSPEDEPAEEPVGSARPRLTSSGAYERPVIKPHPGVSKIEKVKAWTFETLRTTKQFINEKLGRGSRTVDPQLDAQIEQLHDLQARYRSLVEQTCALHSNLSNLLLTQKQLVNCFADLALRDRQSTEDFTCNAETHRILICNGEQLLVALSFFISSMKTLVHKTIEDCLDTVKKYEAARLQYDTYRTEYEQLIIQGTAASLKTAEISEKYDLHKRNYEQLKVDVSCKIRFLDENRVKVVHRQLMFFHNVIAAYFSGNRTQLEEVLTQFNVKLRSPNSEPPSWLENSE